MKKREKIKIKITGTPFPRKGCVTLVALPFPLKSILRQKKELWKLKYFNPAKIDLMFKKLLQKKPKSFKILL
jgi:hypothetical protein